MSGFTRENHDKGMLIDDEWMAGISKDPDGFSAFVVDHRSGEVIARQSFPEVDPAIRALSQIPRPWKFESTSGCAGDRCAEGQCKGAGCKLFSGKSPATECSGND